MSEKTREMGYKNIEMGQILERESARRRLGAATWRGR